MTPRQCRAARAMLGWNQARLAREAGYAYGTVADYEIGRGHVSRNAIACMEQALRRHGVTVSAGDPETVTYRERVVASPYRGKAGSPVLP